MSVNNDGYIIIPPNNNDSYDMQYLWVDNIFIRNEDENDTNFNKEKGLTQDEINFCDETYWNYISYLYNIFYEDNDENLKKIRKIDINIQRFLNGDINHYFDNSSQISSSIIENPISKDFIPLQWIRPTQKIGLELKEKKDNSLQFEFSFKQQDLKDHSTFYFGDRTKGEENRFGLMNWSGDQNENNFHFIKGVGSAWNLNKPIINGKEYTIQWIRSSYFRIDDGTDDDDTNHIYMTGIPEVETNELYLFGANWTGQTTNICDILFHYFKISDFNSKLKYYIPIKKKSSNNWYGLYDLIEKKEIEVSNYPNSNPPEQKSSTIFSIKSDRIRCVKIVLNIKSDTGILGPQYVQNIYYSNIDDYNFSKFYNIYDCWYDGGKWNFIIRDWSKIREINFGFLPFLHGSKKDFFNFNWLNEDTYDNLKLSVVKKDEPSYQTKIYKYWSATTEMKALPFYYYDVNNNDDDKKNLIYNRKSYYQDRNLISYFKIKGKEIFSYPFIPYIRSDKEIKKEECIFRTLGKSYDEFQKSLNDKTDDEKINAWNSYWKNNNELWKNDKIWFLVVTRGATPPEDNSVSGYSQGGDDYRYFFGGSPAGTGASYICCLDKNGKNNVFFKKDNDNFYDLYYIEGDANIRLTTTAETSIHYAGHYFNVSTWLTRLFDYYPSIDTNRWTNVISVSTNASLINVIFDYFWQEDGYWYQESQGAASTTMNWVCYSDNSRQDGKDLDGNRQFSFLNKDFEFECKTQGLRKGKKATDTDKYISLYPDLTKHPFCPNGKYGAGGGYGAGYAVNKYKDNGVEFASFNTNNIRKKLENESTPGNIWILNIFGPEKTE